MKFWKQTLVCLVGISMMSSLSGCIVYKNQMFGELSNEGKREVQEEMQKAKEKIARDDDFPPFLEGPMTWVFDQVEEEFSK